MSRFYLSDDASADLVNIRRYLIGVPERFGLPIRQELRELLHEIAEHPYRGTTHSEATRLLGQEIRTRVLPPYRLFYKDTRGTPEILAILHMAQDVNTILRERLQ